MDTAQEKIDELQREPATKNMKAVRENKFIVVPGVGLDRPCAPSSHWRSSPRKFQG